MQLKGVKWKRTKMQNYMNKTFSVKPKVLYTISFLDCNTLQASAEPRIETTG